MRLSDRELKKIIQSVLDGTAPPEIVEAFDRAVEKGRRQATRPATAAQARRTLAKLRGLTISNIGVVMLDDGRGCLTLACKNKPSAGFIFTFGGRAGLSTIGLHKKLIILDPILPDKPPRRKARTAGAS